MDLIRQLKPLAPYIDLRYTSETVTQSKGLAESSTSQIALSSQRRSDLKTLNLLCWSLFVCLLALPSVLSIRDKSESFRRVPEINFVYFYSMGRLFSYYPATEVYNPQLQQRVCMATCYSSRGWGPIPYPPFVGLLFRPFAQLSFFHAFFLWTVLSCSLYLGSLALLIRRFYPGSFWERGLVFCFALSVEPFLRIMVGGHLSLLGFAALSLAFYEQSRDRPVRSGLALAGCLFKPTLLLLFIPMLAVTKRFRVLLGLLAGGVFLFVLTTWIEGPAIWSDYWRMARSFGSTAVNRNPHGVIQSASYVDLVSFFSVLPGGQSLVARALLWLIAAGAALVLLRLCLRFRNDMSGPTQSLLWAATLTLTLVINVYVPIYDSVLVVLSIVVTAGLLKQSTPYPVNRRFTLSCIALLVVSWLAVPIANASGVQILTLFLLVLGALQVNTLVKLVGQSKTRLNFLVPKL